MTRFVPVSVLVLLAAGLVPSPAPAQATADAALIQKARAIHDRVIALDTHDDIDPGNFTRQKNYTQRLDTQVNIPKMKEGGLDASFFIVYVGQGPLTPEGYDSAYKQAVAKFDAVHHLTKEIAPDQIELALTAADVPRIAKSGKKVALIGIENAYPIGTDIKRVKEFFDRGGRYMSLAHNGHSQLSDSNTGERDGVWLHHGLSPLGREVIAEMNRVGMMIDISHPSKQSMMQALDITKAPIIASHSAVRALCNHSRNLDDEQLLGLKKNGGVAQLVAFSGYVKCGQDTPERAQALTALRERYGMGQGRGGFQGLSDSARTAFQRDMQELNKQYPPPPRATVADFVNHIDYAVKLIGIDHVGISSDFDGGGGVDGWNNAEETFNVTLELVKRGYSEEQISKLWSGNLLRVMEENEKVARKLRATS